MTQGSSFESAYDGKPPWDIDRPQREIVRLAERGKIQGKVLDVGCGTGENALYLGDLGYQVVGVDLVQRAVERAMEKALQRGLDTTFLRRDALHLEKTGGPYDTAVDSGLFHVFSDEERPVFVASLATAVRSGGMYYMVCFSEREPGTWGPRRVTRAEIRHSFSVGWKIESIEEAVFETNVESSEVSAWLSSIRRL